MIEDKDDVTQDSSLDEETADSSTAEETQETEQPQEVKEPPFHEHPRWKEVQDEKNRAREEADYWRSQATNLVDKFQQPGASQPSQQEVDIITKYGAQDANTREFLRDMTQEMRREANKIADERSSQLTRENEALRRTVAGIQEKIFRQENIDVEPNSPEEKEIATYVSMGMPLDKATKAVMFDKRVAEAQRGTKVQKTKQATTKAQANLEQSSIPRKSGIPEGENLSFKEKMRRGMDKVGL